MTKAWALLCALACLAMSVSEAGSEDEKRRVPLYTNEDLERVAPFREQTGVASKRAPEARSPAGDDDAGRGSARHKEAYWRREAERLRERTRPIRENIAELRRRIDERWRKPGLLASSDPQIQSWQQRLRVLEDRIREWEDALDERARREGALPGWLR